MTTAPNWPLCSKCCRDLGAIPSPWPVTCTMAKCTRCGEEAPTASYHDYTWPDGDKAVWD